ncbi:MAG TPA: FtsX-like permease family protein, partial [Actinomycetota bacterium]
PEAPVVLPSYVGVETASGVPPETVATAINDQVEGVDAVDRDTAVASLPGVSSISQSFAIILGLAFVVVVLLIGFFFLIITVQKLAPLTLLRAVGASGGFLLRNLALQVLLVVGAGLAIAVGLLALSAAALSEQAVGVRFDPVSIGTTAAALVVLGLLASVASMRRVASIDPAAATVRTGGGGLA